MCMSIDRFYSMVLDSVRRKVDTGIRGRSGISSGNRYGPHGCDGLGRVAEAGTARLGPADETPGIAAEHSFGVRLPTTEVRRTRRGRREDIEIGRAARTRRRIHWGGLLRGVITFQ